MYTYLVGFFHTYLVHVGAWGAYYGFMAIKDGKEIKWHKLFVASFILASLSAFTHNHYMQFLKG